MIHKKKIPTFQIALGGLFLALFFFASNLLPPIYPFANVPVTLQTGVIALMGGLLGIRVGSFTLLALYLLTLAGLPMMASFHGGPAAFFSPTAGFIFGWIFLVLLGGLCRRAFTRREGRRGRLFLTLTMTAFLAAGLLLDYAAGALWFAFYCGDGAAAFPAVFGSFLIFLPFDLVKCAAAASLCAALTGVPAFVGNTGLQRR